MLKPIVKHCHVASTSTIVANFLQQSCGVFIMPVLLAQSPFPPLILPLCSAPLHRIPSSFPGMQRHGISQFNKLQKIQ